MSSIVNLNVNVTLAHIQAGQRARSSECPIALALNEQHPRPGGWSVGRDHAAYWDGRRFALLELPREAVDFIQAFDHARECGSLTFWLREEN